MTDTQWFRMNPTTKAQWLRALRSGEYEQGRACLRQADALGVSYCCLGVLADVVDSDGWDNKGWMGRSSWRTNYTALLPPDILPKSLQSALTAKNDGLSQTFPDIADWIEANIPTSEEPAS